MAVGASVFAIGTVIDLCNGFSFNKVVGFIGFFASASGGVLAATSSYRPHFRRRSRPRSSGAAHGEGRARQRTQIKQIDIRVRHAPVGAKSIMPLIMRCATGPEAERHPVNSCGHFTCVLRRSSRLG